MQLAYPDTFMLRQSFNADTGFCAKILTSRQELDLGKQQKADIECHRVPPFGRSNQPAIDRRCHGNELSNVRAAKSVVGVAGFEPTTPCPPDKCANQAALHSDCRPYRESFSPPQRTSWQSDAHFTLRAPPPEGACIQRAPSTTRAADRDGQPTG